MTEQEYQELVEAAADSHCGVRPFGGMPEVMYHHEYLGFKAGAEWARRNPGPEVLELVETTKLATTYLDKEVRRLADDLPESLWGYLMSLIYSLNKSLTKFDAARSEK